MITVTLYSRDECHLCEQAIADLEELQAEYPHQLQIVNIDGDRQLQRKYGLDIPVVEIGPYSLKAPISPQELRLTMAAAADRVRQIEAIEQQQAKGQASLEWAITRSDRLWYWLSEHHLAMFNLFLIIYLGLSFLPPLLMVSGLTLPARLLYLVYGWMCHQFAYRSWFLFGPQLAYPRAAAGVPGMTYGQVTGLDEADWLAARQFIGNPALGYKIALCERDVAIFAGFLLFGLIYALAGKRIKSLPWYLWIPVGIFPIALDGFSQLLSQPPFDLIPLLGLLPYRESTPFLRTLTGLLFGVTTFWFAYPSMAESMAETRRFLAARLGHTSA